MMPRPQTTRTISTSLFLTAELLWSWTRPGKWNNLSRKYRCKALILIGQKPSRGYFSSHSFWTWIFFVNLLHLSKWRCFSSLSEMYYVSIGFAWCAPNLGPTNPQNHFLNLHYYPELPIPIRQKRYIQADWLEYRRLSLPWKTKSALLFLYWYINILSWRDIYVYAYLYCRTG